jgi:hypothetical protein
MGTGVYWEVFESTGSIEAFLAYRKTEEVAPDPPPVNSEELETKSLEGDE